MSQSKQELKDYLAHANLEIMHATGRVDAMSDDEVASLKTKINKAAFFDINGVCGSVEKLNKTATVWANVKQKA